jgi:hypothetical protein
MVTLRSSQDYYTCDAKKPVLAWTADGRYGGEDDSEAAGVEWLLAGEAGIKPGMPIYRSTGTDGEDTAEKADDGGESANAHRLYGVAGLDKAQVEDCGTAYDNGDKIPVLPFHRFLGAIFRNVILLDPGAAVDPDTPLGTGADGFNVMTESTLVANGSSPDGFNSGNAGAGDFSDANGAYIFNREFMKTKYGFGDPAGDTTVVAYVVRA